MCGSKKMPNNFSVGLLTINRIGCLPQLLTVTRFSIVGMVVMDCYVIRQKNN